VPDFPYRLTRVGVVMTPLPGDELEAEGVLNPGSGRGPDGELYLLPRLVAAGNVSRVGLARVVVADGVPVGVERQGVVLAPDRAWERGATHAGVEDPRVTWIEALGVHAMTYVAYGPFGPRTAVAVSTDLRRWRRLGPVTFDYVDELDTDLGLFHNKDTVFFPTPVTGPDGAPSLAVLHRPMWHIGATVPGEGSPLPAGIEDPRHSIWISYVSLDDAARDLGALTRWGGHRFLAGPEHPFEELKIGAGPPPRRVPEGWLVLHHGVTGVIDDAFAQQRNVSYAAGGLLLDAVDPSVVIGRSAEPLLTAETDEEREGTVPNVVFPTAIEDVAGVPYVFYGMADSRIGVARLEHT
jgi:beta-1,2-mannobiose phosphorylase / 1,2-beta-oligomannan phosphorylase